MALSDIPGKVRVPNTLPLGLILTLTVAGVLGWTDLHRKIDQNERVLVDLRAARGQSMAELRQGDAALSAAIEAVKDTAATRQEQILTRLTRIETILDRMDRQAAPAGR